MVSSRLLYFCIIFSFTLISNAVNGHGGGEEDEEEEKKEEMAFKYPVVILISFDGFRFSYLERLKDLKKTSAIWKLINEGGVYDADGMNTTFATVTFPNHYTIATGLYQENHGIISNLYYDPNKNQTVDIRTTEGLKFLYGGEPIWETLGKTKKIDVGCYMWAGCMYGEHIKNFTKFSHVVDWENTVKEVISWINSGVQFVSLYWSQPDGTGHSSGPDSFEMNITLKEIDDSIAFLMKSIENIDGLKGAVNFIIVSDHGMTKALDKVAVPLRSDLFTVLIQEKAFWHVKPLEGKMTETIDYLKSKPHLDVYKKDEIPYHWHYRQNDRIGDVLVVAKLGYILVSNEREREIPAGVHGYSPDLPDMRSVFVANGPAFKRHADETTTHIAITDIYLLICKIFGVTPAANNGSEHSVLAILNQGYLRSINHHVLPHTSKNLWIVVISSASVILFVMVIYFLHRASYQKRKRRNLTVSHVSTAQNGATGFVYRRIPNEQIVPLLSDKNLEHTLDDSDNESI